MEELRDTTIQVTKDNISENYGFQVKKYDAMTYCTVSHIVDNNKNNKANPDISELQLGDLLIAVNDISLADQSVEDMYDIIDQNSKNDMVNLTIRSKHQLLNSNNHNGGENITKLNGNSRIKIKRKIGLGRDPSLDGTFESNNNQDHGQDSNNGKKASPIAQINIDELMASDDDAIGGQNDCPEQPVDGVNLRVKKNSEVDKIPAKKWTKEAVLEDLTTDKSKINKLLYTRSRRCQSDGSQGSQKHLTKLLINGKEIPGAIAEEDTSKNGFIRLKNWSNSSYLHDTLHKKAKCPMTCGSQVCYGSSMNFLPEQKPEYTTESYRQYIIDQAVNFIREYYLNLRNENPNSNIDFEKEELARLEQIIEDVEQTGFYEQTYSELVFGAKLAWRNATRCIGRIQWSRLKVFDARHVKTTDEMFQAICEHLKYATNNGNLRSVLTIFAPRNGSKQNDFRIWNAQLIRYAGYKMDDGSIIGDRATVEFTELCLSFGWRGSGGRFDVLPLILQANGGEPQFYEIPPELVLEVCLRHPKYPWFENLGLKWYALPAVANMMFDVGGIEFPCAPFNGWYMGTEIGSRDLGDTYRYNVCETVGQHMGLDTKNNSSLWKDKALVELNIAVLYSFQEDNVTIVDHHSVSESFMNHLEHETSIRGGCPSDWIWLVPPLSGSASEVYHQELLSYRLKPSFEYQPDPAIDYYKRKRKRRIKFKNAGNAILFAHYLIKNTLAKRPKVTILYATETGKSEYYAKIVTNIFSYGFDVKLVCMKDYDPSNLSQEKLLLIVTSTFGNGDPPDNGVKFGSYLYQRCNPRAKVRENRRSIHLPRGSNKPMLSRIASSNYSNMKYAVFGLGSRAYPHFCAFARSVDRLLCHMGAERIHDIGEGDELFGQEDSFRKWTEEIFHISCESFHLKSIDKKDALSTLYKNSNHWYPGKFRMQEESLDIEKTDICIGLSKVHGKEVISGKLISRQNLQSTSSDRSTILVRIGTKGKKSLSFHPGDHLAIFPANHPRLVQRLINALHDAPDPDQPIKIEYCQEKAGQKIWQVFDRLPLPCTLRDAFTYYLDITTPPTPQMLQHLATEAARDTDKQRLELLGRGSQKYEDWKFEKCPHIIEVIEEFPSLKVSPLLLLTQLPLLQQRYYSISSSPKLHKNEIHCTVAVVSYRTSGGLGVKHEGVCSNWLTRLEAGATIPCFVRPDAAFHMPEDVSVPIILIGPGTGIAPFRSFWQQRFYDMNLSTHRPVEQDIAISTHSKFAANIEKKRSHLRRTQSDASDYPPTGTRSKDRGETDVSGKSKNHCSVAKSVFGEMILYFGCRNSKTDDIYKDELRKALTDHVLTHVQTAYSRQEHKPKQYVQDLIKKDAFELCKLILDHGAHIYVCGDVSMSADVGRTIQNVLEDYGAMSSTESQECITRLRDSGRYHEDIFGVTLRTFEVTTNRRKAAQRAWILVSGDDKTVKASASGSSIIPRIFPKAGGGVSAGSPKLRHKVRSRRARHSPTVTVLLNPDEQQQLFNSNTETQTSTESNFKRLLERRHSVHAAKPDECDTEDSDDEF